MTDLPLFTPIIVLSLGAFLLLAIDAFTREPTEDTRRISFSVTILVLLAAASFLRWTEGNTTLAAPSMLIWDGLSYFLSWVALSTVFLVVLMSARFRGFQGTRVSAYYALLLFATAGLFLVASANDFLMVFIGIELVGLPTLILVGYLRRQTASVEGALKFFVVGAFASAMLAYGISVLYGLTGSTSLTLLGGSMTLLHEHATLARVAVVLLFVSFGFKSGLVPFHMWVPDAMEGAPVPISAFISVAPKIAGLALILRVFEMSFPVLPQGIAVLLAVLAVLTMSVANLVGLRQTNAVRLLAYSSIAQMGYMVMGLVVGNPVGVSAMYFYAAVYLFMNIGAFAIIASVFETTSSHDLTAFEGLAQRAPRLSALLAFFLFSLAGLPPTAGFLAKFNVFLVAYQNGWLWLVVVSALNTALSTVYYLKILHAVYFKAPSINTPVAVEPAPRLVLALTLLVTLAMGFAPQFFLSKADVLAGVPAAPPPAAIEPLPAHVSIPEQAEPPHE